MSQFSEWLIQVFLAWEREEGKRKTVTAFAQHLGVPQSSLSSWMSGAYSPSKEAVRQIAAVLGPKAFDAAGLERPPEADPDLAYIISAWERLDQSARQLIVQLVSTRLHE